SALPYAAFAVWAGERCNSLTQSSCQLIYGDLEIAKSRRAAYRPAICTSLTNSRWHSSTSRLSASYNGNAPPDEPIFDAHGKQTGVRGSSMVELDAFGALFAEACRSPSAECVETQGRFARSAHELTRRLT